MERGMSERDSEKTEKGVGGKGGGKEGVRGKGVGRRHWWGVGREEDDGERGGLWGERRKVVGRKEGVRE